MCESRLLRWNRIWGHGECSVAEHRWKLDLAFVSLISRRGPDGLDRAVDQLEQLLAALERTASGQPWVSVLSGVVCDAATGRAGLDEAVARLEARIADACVICGASGEAPTPNAGADSTPQDLCRLARSTLSLLCSC